MEKIPRQKQESSDEMLAREFLDEAVKTAKESGVEGGVLEEMLRTYEITPESEQGGVEDAPCSVSIEGRKIEYTVDGDTSRIVRIDGADPIPEEADDILRRYGKLLDLFAGHEIARGLLGGFEEVLRHF